MSDPLDALARRAASEPLFLACRLAAYQRDRGLSDPELAEDLRCSTDALTMLRLCRAPREGDDGAEGMADVRCVAERFGYDAGRLAAALGVWRA